MRQKLRSWKALGIVAAIGLALAASPSAATVSVGETLGNCGYQGLERPFRPWLDLASYTFAPNGGLENGTTDWTLSGGPRVVAGNEAFYVHSRSDSHALSLPTGASAKTQTMCVGLLDPTLRLFVANSGSVLSTLRVEVLYTDFLGVARTVPVGVVLSTPAWQPTLPILFLANLTSPPLITNGTTAVAFRFTAQGSFGGWKIDDVYLDPYKGG
jgi:hypothetical protein